MTKEPRTYNGERIVSSANGVGKTGYPHAKEKNWTPILHTPKLKINPKCIKDLNIRHETIKLLQENIVGKLLGIHLGNDFWGVDTKNKATKAKINKWNYIKLKSFYTAKKTINKMKRQTMK